jgi:CRP-like cAMP-binding protein
VNLFDDEKDDGFFTIAKLKEGSSFGEMALINNKLRMATVRCLKNSNFMVISKESYI